MLVICQNSSYICKQISTYHNLKEPMKEKYAPEHINYALVEDTRPPMYKAMKYWGRKPHNIWGDYITHYCPKDGVVLDPFMGSGISTFESLKLGRKIIFTAAAGIPQGYAPIAE